MDWTAEDLSGFGLAGKTAGQFDARLVGLEPPSYGVMSMAWADAGMGAPIGGGLAEDAEERQRVAAVRQAFDSRTAGLEAEWRAPPPRRPPAGRARRPGLPPIRVTPPPPPPPTTWKRCLGG